MARKVGATPGKSRRGTREAGVDALNAPPAPERDLPPGIVDRPRTPFSLQNTAIEQALRAGEQSGRLEDLFGATALADLRGLARDAEGASIRGSDRVLILPGIMGSKLGYPGPLLFDDAIWVDPIDIAVGRLEELRLTNGRPGDVQTLGAMLFAYLALKLRLRIAGHAAEFFAFDWRLGITELGRRLATELKRDKQRTHLVCHSMGGLVARAMLRDGGPNNLGRIVTLGTPHEGSYSPVQAFRGVHSIVRKMAALDQRHDQAGLADIFGTFPGLLEMMPSPRRRPIDFFDQAAWPAQGPRPGEVMLRAAREAQATLLPLTELQPLPP